MPRSATPKTSFTFGVESIDAGRPDPAFVEEEDMNRALGLVPIISSLGLEWGTRLGEYKRYEQRYLDLAARKQPEEDFDVRDEMDYLWRCCQPYLESGSNILYDDRFAFYQAIGDMTLIAGRLSLENRKELMSHLKNRLALQIPDRDFQTDGLTLNDLITLYGLAHKEDAHDAIASIPLEESDYPEGLRVDSRRESYALEDDSDHRRQAGAGERAVEGGAVPAGVV